MVDRRSGSQPQSKLEANREACRLVRAEMQRRGVTYRMLARRLSEAGVSETERNLVSRITRGTFTFAFALQILRAIGVTRLDIRERDEDADDADRPWGGRL